MLLSRITRVATQRRSLEKPMGSPPAQPLIPLRRSRKHHGSEGHHSGPRAAAAAATEHRDAAGWFGKRHGFAQHGGWMWEENGKVWFFSDLSEVYSHWDSQSGIFTSWILMNGIFIIPRHCHCLVFCDCDSNMFFLISWSWEESVWETILVHFWWQKLHPMFMLFCVLKMWRNGDMTNSDIFWSFRSSCVSSCFIDFGCSKAQHSSQLGIQRLE